MAGLINKPGNSHMRLALGGYKMSGCPHLAIILKVYRKAYVDSVTYSVQKVSTAS